MTDFELSPPEKDICKIHTDRSNKYLSRINTSKLSKEELEDLYYEIFENNIELKRIVNQQKQTINALNTKVLRMTATRKSPISSNPCCVDSRVVIREQKEMIQELKLTNEKLIEKIRQLKVQLCTNKQFTKTSPNQKSRSRPPFTANNNSSVRNRDSDTSIVIHYNNSSVRNKESETSLIIEVPKEHAEEKEADSSNKTENSVGNHTKNSPEKLCTENKCNTQMDELKEKIGNLEEELNIVQQSCNARIASLEDEIKRLSKEEQAARAARVTSQAALTKRQEEAKKLAAALRNMETHTNQLSAQLQFEKMKVSDLEMQLKTNGISNNMFDIIEEYFNKRISKSQLQRAYCKESVEILQRVESDHNEDTEICQVDKDITNGDHRIVSSFFSPKRNFIVEESLAKANADLCEKVVELQTELDMLKVFIAGQEVSSSKKTNKCEPLDDQTKQSEFNSTDDTIVGFKNTVEDQCSEQKGQDMKLEEYTSLSSEKEKLNEKPKDSENRQFFKSEHTVNQENNTSEINISHNNTAEGEQNEELGGNKNREHSLPNTYTLKHETVDVKKSSSPENTDYDVSSITDASSAKSPKDSSDYTKSLTTTPRSPTEPLSLGENRELSYLTEYTSTSSGPNTTDKSLGYLSEGEIPSGNFMLSCEWAEIKEKYKRENLVSSFQESKAEKLKSALQQVKQHLMKCKQLQTPTKSGLYNSNDI